MIVVDASALLEVLLQTPSARIVTDRLFKSGESLAAPQLIDVEVAQVLRRYQLTGELEERRGREALEDLADMPLARYSHKEFLPRTCNTAGKNSGNEQRLQREGQTLSARGIALVVTMVVQNCVAAARAALGSVGTAET